MGKKLKQEDFVRRVWEVYGDSYTILTEYTSQHEKVLVRHRCGYEWHVDPWSLLQSHIKECPKCNNKWKRDTEAFKREVVEKYGGEYEVVGEYIGTNKNVLMRHTKCGKEFMRMPRELKQGVLCPECRRPNYHETTETYRKRLDEKYDGKYELLSEYTYARAKVNVKCNQCGTIWEATPDNLMRGHRCPKCTISRGEDRNEAWLVKNGVKHQSQYSDKRCRDERALRFDFAILDENDKLSLLIEYDGAKHFRPTRFSNAMENALCESNLRDTQRKDRIKQDFCNTQGIKLLRINHKQFEKIEDILGESITKDNPVPSR